MAEEKRNVEIKDFPGLQMEVDEYALLTGGSHEQVNCMSSEVGVLASRPGYQVVGFENIRYTDIPGDDGDDDDDGGYTDVTYVFEIQSDDEDAYEAESGAVTVIADEIHLERSGSLPLDPFPWGIFRFTGISFNPNPIFTKSVKFAFYVTEVPDFDVGYAYVEASDSPAAPSTATNDISDRTVHAGSVVIPAFTFGTNTYVEIDLLPALAVERLENTELAVIVKGAQPGRSLTIAGYAEGHPAKLIVVRRES